MKKKVKVTLAVFFVLMISIIFINSYFGSELQDEIMEETGGEEEVKYLSEGLIGYYKFDGNAVESSSEENNGRIIGAEDINGKIGRALEFGGNTEHDYVDLEQKEFLLQEFSLMVWVKPYNVAGRRNIISKHDEWFNFQLDEGKVSLSGKYPWREQILSENSAEENKWYHVAAVRFLNGTAIVYLNGEKEGEGELPDLETNKQIEPLVIGSYDSGWADNFEGRIDEVRIYNKALTSEEIKKIYKISELKSSGITGAVIRSLRRMFTN